MNQTKPDINTHVVYAYEPDQTLREMIGKSTQLADIFTKEKIAACQKLVDDAKQSFFDTAQADMDTMSGLVKNKARADNYQEFCRQLFQLANNIKGQAEVFGFPLITRVCKYLTEYTESGASANRMTARDIFIIIKLVEALHRAFQEKIVDAGGAIEKELIWAVEQARK